MSTVSLVFIWFEGAPRSLSCMFTCIEEDQRRYPRRLIACFGHVGFGMYMVRVQALPLMPSKLFLARAKVRRLGVTDNRKFHRRQCGKATNTPLQSANQSYGG